SEKRGNTGRGPDLALDQRQTGFMVSGDLAEVRNRVDEFLYVGSSRPHLVEYFPLSDKGSPGVRVVFHVVSLDLGTKKAAPESGLRQLFRCVTASLRSSNRRGQVESI